MESCNDKDDNYKCNEESIGKDGLYCFKAYFENEENEEDKTECMTCPTNPEHQKLYFQLANGINKEAL